MSGLQQIVKELPPSKWQVLVRNASATFSKEENGVKYYVNRSTKITITVQAGQSGVDRVVILKGVCVC